MKDSVGLAAVAIAFLLVSLAGAQLALATGPCTGTVSSGAGRYVIGCSGSCEPDHSGPCQPDGSNPNDPDGLRFCICGPKDDINFPANSPCNTYLSWTLTLQGRKYSVDCIRNTCPELQDCEALALGGITIDPLTGWLSGSGTVTCPCE